MKNPEIFLHFVTKGEITFHLAFLADIGRENLTDLSSYIYDNLKDKLAGVENRFAVNRHRMGMLAPLRLETLF